MSTLTKQKTAPSLFTDFFGRDFFNDEVFNLPAEKWLPSANVKEKKESYELELAVPGMQKHDLSIHMEDDVLIIQGEHSEEKEETGRYTRREFATTSFERTFRLPKTVDVEQVQAKYENGILRLNLPKKAEAIQQGPKEIRVS